MIFRGTTITASDSDKKSHKVKVLIDGIWEDKKQVKAIESINGLFLRKGEEVYVWMSEDYDSALILGRTENWLDANNMTSLINTLITEINETRKAMRSFMDAYNKHTHGGVYTGAMFSLSVQQTPTNQPMLLSQKDVPRDMKKITVDDIIEK